MQEEFISHAGSLTMASLIGRQTKNIRTKYPRNFGQRKLFYEIIRIWTNRSDEKLTTEADAEGHGFKSVEKLDIFQL
jgi:hypothetical protein